MNLDLLRAALNHITALSDNGYEGAFQGGNTMTHPPNTHDLPCGAATHTRYHETSPGHLFHLCTKPAIPEHPWHGCGCGLRWRCSTNPLGRTA